MDLSALRLLVRRFVDGEISHEEFYSQFVMNYLSVLHQDFDIERDVNAIENAWSDFAEGDISADELRLELSEIANAPIFIVRVNAQTRSDSRSSRAIYVTKEELVA